MNGEPSRARPLRIVHITTVPQTLAFCHGQIDYFRSRGLDVSAISSPGPLLDRFAAREKVTVYGVPMERGIAPLRDLVSLIRLVRVLRRLGPDIVHSHSPKAGLLGTLAARLLRKRSAVSIFGLVQMTQSGFRRTLLDAMTRLSTALAQRVWINSHSLRDYAVARKLVSPDKVVVFGAGSAMGVDAAHLLPATADARMSARKAFGIPADAFVVGFAGRIVRDKGVHELLDAWQALRNSWSDIHLLIAGEAEERDAVSPEAMFMLQSDSRIHFLGLCNDMPTVYAAMDVFVLPSYREGFPMVNLEAAAMALPTITTDVPGCIDSVVDEVTGSIIPVRDAFALQRAIERYYHDRPTAALHGSAGRERVLRDFDPETIWRGLAAMYRELSNRS